MSGNHKRKRRNEWIERRWRSVTKLMTLLYRFGVTLDKEGLPPMKFDFYTFTRRQYELERTKQHRIRNK